MAYMYVLSVSVAKAGTGDKLASLTLISR